MNYGSALKTGFHNSSGKLLGFMDADNTINPFEFEKFYIKWLKEKNDIIVGNRLNEKSKMPLIRKLGNYAYIFFIYFLTGKKISDSASGIRLFTKKFYSKLLPLPSGLNFTPVMTAKALCINNVSYSEIEIEYNERIGESKLNVLKDGWLFFSSIFLTVFYRNPQILFFPAGLFIYLLFIIYSTGLYQRFNSQNINDIIYRIISISFFGIFGTLMLSFGAFLNNIISLINKDISKSNTKTIKILNFIFYENNHKIGIFLFLFAFVLIIKPFFQYITTFNIYVHWSVIIFSGTLFSISFILLIFYFLKKIFFELISIK